MEGWNTIEEAMHGHAKNKRSIATLIRLGKLHLNISHTQKKNSQN